jgi:hypothetical protein
MLLEISAARYSGAIEVRCEKVTPLGSMSPSRDFNVEMRVGVICIELPLYEDQGTLDCLTTRLKRLEHTKSCQEKEGGRSN